jgi:ribosome-binding protein aMBF1 (putative translation factor)
MTKLVQGVSCEICHKQRIPGEIHSRQSKLLNTKLLVCNNCAEKGFEPRSFIVIVAKKDGNIKAVADYIKNHKYIGEQITAKEILK